MHHYNNWLTSTVCGLWCVPMLQKHLTELVAASQPGDVVFFHYSGHGTQVCVFCAACSAIL